MSAQLENIRDQLRNEMNSASPNLQNVGQLLIQAKVSLEVKYIEYWENQN